MTHRILVTGATGKVGSEVMRLLPQKQPVRAAMTHLGRDRTEHLPPEIDCVEFDFLKPETFATALQGVSQIFLIRPPAIAQIRQLDPFIQAAKNAGVSHIVFLSLLGAENLPFIPHAKIEQSLRSIGIPYTFLRPSFFMQNLSTVHRDDIKNHNEIFLPAGKGKTSFIDVRDIAAVAVKALTEAGHANQAYSLTGSEALDYAEVAAIFTTVLSRPIRYSNPSIWQFATTWHKRGVSIDFILVMLGIYTTARLGLAAQVTSDTEQLLQRKPISVQQFVEDYRSVWQ